MQVEYFEDPQASPPRVLLTCGSNPTDAELLREAISPLRKAAPPAPVQVDSLPGFRSVGGCSLIAQLGDENLGVTRICGRENAFCCVLTSMGWRLVHGLLEPFADSEASNARHWHQYLTEHGPAAWIVSTDRQW